jgi:hypothetical protein
MQVKYPQLTASVDRQRSVTWTGPWRPTELSNEYTVRISYRQGFRPKIAVLHPHLELAPGNEKLPHVYADGQNDICVHRPEEWNKGMSIALTIMPRISQWLYFYEVWVITGKWLGKGTHPSLPQHAETAPTIPVKPRPHPIPPNPFSPNPS